MRWHVVGQRIEPAFGKRGRMERAAARGRAEAAVRERRDEPIHTRIGQPDVPARHQLVEARVRERGVVEIERLPHERLVGLGERGMIEPHRAGETAEEFGVGHTLAGRLDGAVIDEHVVVAIAPVDVHVLGLHRGRKQVVGVARGVGHEVLVHDGEQILAREPREHARAIRRNRCGVRVVDHEGLDRRRAALTGQGRCRHTVRRERITKRAHVDDARQPPGLIARHEIGPLERGRVDRVGTRGGEEQSARPASPCPGERGQAGDRADRHAATAVALHAVVEPDRRATRATVAGGERFDRLGRQAADLGGTCG